MSTEGQITDQPEKVTVTFEREEAEALLLTEEHNDQDQNLGFAEALALNKIRAALADPQETTGGVDWLRSEEGGSGNDARPAPQLPFLYGREQGNGNFKDALENLILDLRGLLFAANPGQQVVIDREHIDRDGFYFVARVKPYLTEVQFRAAAATNPSPEEAGDA